MYNVLAPIKPPRAAAQAAASLSPDELRALIEAARSAKAEAEQLRQEVRAIKALSPGMPDLHAHIAERYSGARIAATATALAQKLQMMASTLVGATEEHKIRAAAAAWLKTLTESERAEIVLGRSELIAAMAHMLNCVSPFWSSLPDVVKEQYPPGLWGFQMSGAVCGSDEEDETLVWLCYKRQFGDGLATALKHYRQPHYIVEADECPKVVATGLYGAPLRWGRVIKGSPSGLFPEGYSGKQSVWSRSKLGYKPAKDLGVDWAEPSACPPLSAGGLLCVLARTTVMVQREMARAGDPVGNIRAAAVRACARQEDLVVQSEAGNPVQISH
jgi:hypothetical protein